MNRIASLIQSMEDLGWDMKEYESVVNQVEKLKQRIANRDEDFIEVSENDLVVVRFAADIMRFLLFRVEEEMK